MQTMQPILEDSVERSDDFLYEMKYDGFRAVLYWSPSEIIMKSRKNTDLTAQFPEVIGACRKHQSVVESCLPIQLDGELVILNHQYEANFSLIQQRGRMRKKQKINETATQRPASFLVFDILMWKGSDMKQERLDHRKKKLEDFFKFISAKELQEVPVFTNYTSAKKVMNEFKTEGLVAKRKKGPYLPGKVHRDWLKEKNWRTIYGFLLHYQPDNGYYQLGVFDDNEVRVIGHCKHGLSDNERQTLKRIIKKEGSYDGKSYTIPPAICAAIHTLGLKDGEMREPSFVELKPQMDASTCTVDNLKTDLAMLPDTVSTTNETKLYWPGENLTKEELLIYVREIFPFMIPYLSQHALTIIRCPEGVEDTCFFQKNLPDYSPRFMHRADETIVCDHLDSLIWLANHGAVEYHIPFEILHKPNPDQIVFDLDPPSVEAFSLAIETALLFQKIFDELHLTTFIKTSGSKGLQIHLPLPKGQFTYHETAQFTKKLADMIVEAAPDLCTTERLKKNRQGKLYIDYVQHGKNKTIIAPYSPRKTKGATIATPLDWKEVNQDLSPDQFTLQTVLSRIKKQGCPWYFEYEKARTQSFEKAAPLFMD